MNPAAAAALLAASKIVLAEGRHDESCTYRDHFAPCAFVRGSKKHAALYAALLATAPACDCYLSKVAAAVALASSSVA